MIAMRRLRTIVLLALLLPLLTNVAPPPAALPPATIHVQDRGAIVAVLQPTQQQDCTSANAPNRFREVVYDGRGYAYGEVAGWSCTSAAEALLELERRRDAMRAEALARYPAVTP